MGIVSKHTTQTTVADSANPNDIGANQWNESHILQMTGPGLAGASLSGTQDVVEVGVGSGLALTGGTLDLAPANQVAFSSVIDLSTSKIMTPQIVSGAIAFTASGTPKWGTTVIARLYANGTNTPTFSAAFKERSSSKGYATARGSINDIRFAYNGYEITYTIDSTGVADIDAPTLSSAVISNGAPTVVALTFNEILDQTATLQPSDFTVSGKTVSGVAFASSTVINVTVSAAFVAGSSHTIAYNKSATAANNIKDLVGNATASIGATSITNNVAGAPTTVNFTEAQITAGFFGYFNSTSNSGQKRFASKAVWSGYITGTQAVLYCGPNGTPFFVSIDNADETQPTVAGGQVTLFTGLSDTAHFVQIRVDGSYNDNGYFTRGGNMMSVTGVAPTVADIMTYAGGGAAWNIHDASFPGQHTFSKLGRTSLQEYGTNMLPNHNMSTRGGLYNNAGAIRIRAKGDAIWVCAYERKFAVATAGVTAICDITSTDFNTAKHPSYDRIAVWRRVITGLSQSTYKDYIVTPSSDDVAGQPILGIMITGPGAAFQALTNTKTVTQYGDSRTAAFAAGGAVACDLDTYNWGAQLGILAATKGHSGIGSLQLLDELPAVLAKNNQVSEYAVLAIGTNDNVSTNTTPGASTVSGAVSNSTSVTVADASTFQVDQYIKPPTGTPFEPSGTSPVGSVGIPYSTRVISKSGNVLTLSQNVTIANNAAITGRAMYHSIKDIINALLTYGHTKIIVRACSTQYQTTKEQSIIDAVASIANANVVYKGGSIPAGTNNYPGIATADGLHESAAGYITEANFEAADFASFFPA